MPNTPQPPENVESVIDKILSELTEKVTDYGYNDEYGYYNEWADGVKPILYEALLASYAAGRSSMKKDIEAVVPVEKKCKCGKSFNNELLIPHGKVEDIGFNACRSQLLDNMKGIL